MVEFLYKPGRMPWVEFELQFYQEIYNSQLIGDHLNSQGVLNGKK